MDLWLVSLTIMCTALMVIYRSLHRVPDGHSRLLQNMFTKQIHEIQDGIRFVLPWEVIVDVLQCEGDVAPHGTPRWRRVESYPTNPSKAMGLPSLTLELKAETADHASVAIRLSLSYYWAQMGPTHATSSVELFDRFNRIVKDLVKSAVKQVPAAKLDKDQIAGSLPPSSIELLIRIASVTSVQIKIQRQRPIQPPPHANGSGELTRKDAIDRIIKQTEAIYKQFLGSLGDSPAAIALTRMVLEEVEQLDGYAAVEDRDPRARRRRDGNED